jgi:predicted dehydrogenase
MQAPECPTNRHAHRGRETATPLLISISACRSVWMICSGPCRSPFIASLLLPIDPGQTPPPSLHTFLAVGLEPHPIPEQVRDDTEEAQEVVQWGRGLVLAAQDISGPAPKHGPSEAPESVSRGGRNHGRRSIVSGKRFAIVGAGLFGEMHAKAYSTHPGAELAVVCDTNRKRAEEVAERYGAERICADWREVASEKSVDAVSVATPDFAHTEIAVGLAEAGKHLLIEKPLATTVEECEKIVAAAKENGVKLMVDFHNRWSPPFHEAHSFIQQGGLGSPRYAYLRLSNTTFVPMTMLAWADKSSVLWFLGSHVIDMACWLIGEWPNRVYSVSRREVLKGMGVDTPDLFASTLEFPGGAVATIENVWLLPESAPHVVDSKCEVVGTKAAIYVDTTSNRTLVINDESRVRYVDTLGGPVVHGKQLGFAIESIRHFADCVIEDKAPLAPGEDGLEVTRVAKAIEESAATGKPVEIKR